MSMNLPLNDVIKETVREVMITFGVDEFEASERLARALKSEQVKNAILARVLVGEETRTPATVRAAAGALESK